MDYPGMGRDVRHPYDQSLMTYKGHLVLRTLIRCYFSPLARCALNPPIPSILSTASQPLCVWPKFWTPNSNPVHASDHDIENLGCWGTLFILFFLFSLFLCDATVFKYDQVNKFVHTQEREKRCREEHVRKYDDLTHWWCFMGAALDKNTFTRAHMMAVYTSLTWWNLCPWPSLHYPFCLSFKPIWFLFVKPSGSFLCLLQ